MNHELYKLFCRRNLMLALTLLAGAFAPVCQGARAACSGAELDVMGAAIPARYPDAATDGARGAGAMREFEITNLNDTVFERCRSSYTAGGMLGEVKLYAVPTKHGGIVGMQKMLEKQVNDFMLPGEKGGYVYVDSGGLCMSNSWDESASIEVTQDRAVVALRNINCAKRLPKWPDAVTDARFPGRMFGWDVPLDVEDGAMVRGSYSLLRGINRGEYAFYADATPFKRPGVFFDRCRREVSFLTKRLIVLNFEKDVSAVELNDAVETMIGIATKELRLCDVNVVTSPVDGMKRAGSGILGNGIRMSFGVKEPCNASNLCLRVTFELPEGSAMPLLNEGRKNPLK